MHHNDQWRVLLGTSHEKERKGLCAKAVLENGFDRRNLLYVGERFASLERLECRFNTCEAADGSILETYDAASVVLDNAVFIPAEVFAVEPIDVERVVFVRAEIGHGFPVPHVDREVFIVGVYICNGIPLTIEQRDLLCLCAEDGE